ncbi:hypothetical protein BS17DRAFT_432371 [Gyrodon lividus]|nr:hypothetical protein BS17DRAFT_432371 [Gyrodon lividus]
MNSSTVPAPILAFPPLNLSSSTGMGYWGLLAATILLGCTVLQAYFYFRNNTDGWTLKGLVISLCILDTLSWAFFAYGYYYYLVENFGNDLILLSIPWPISAEVFVETIVAFLAQLFFARQLYGVHKRSWPVSVVIGILASVAFGFGIFVGVLALRSDVGQINSRISAVATDINKGFATACDIVATTAMCYFLTIVRTEVARTNAIITSLIIYTINRGVLITLVQGTDLLLYACAPTRYYWVPFHMSLSKVYVNTLLAMLNARSSLKNKRDVLSSVTMANTSQSSGEYASGQRLVARIPAVDSSPVLILSDYAKLS